MAIAALVLAFVFFPLGIVLGHVARGQIKRSGEGGRGLATAALILGYLQVAVIVGVVGVAGVLVGLGAQ
jgi:peptidyl-prolyl cis-trans isomerase B (cyclophilin B)